MEIQEVKLSEITPAKGNFRSTFDGKKYDELRESVRAKGVQQPILLRPVEDKKPFEIVYGERRYRVWCDIAKENGGLTKHTIPAMVKNMTDDEAYDAMLIENIHREDVSPVEQAKGYRAFLKGKDDSAIDDLAVRIGVDKRQIRRTIGVLDLPKAMLKAWDEGVATIGHLELIRTLPEGERKNVFENMINQGWSVNSLKQRIANAGVSLKNAWFDVAGAGCNGCPDNSDATVQMFGDDMLRLCGGKFFFDGAISARTAAVTEPYCDKPGFYGVMSTTREIAEDVLGRAYAAGYRVSCHANGDKAIAMYLDIMEGLQAKYPREDPRNRDIHCTVITKELVAKIKKLGILPTIFGPYPYYHGDKLLVPFGEERLERMFAARTFLDAGVKLAAHSDHPCAPFPPLMAIHALVNRTTKAGKPIGRSQRITVMEALRLYTVNSADQRFDEDRLGSIEEGKLADFVILGRDILTIPTTEIKDIPVDATIVGGKIVYEKK